MLGRGTQIQGSSDLMAFHFGICLIMSASVSNEDLLEADITLPCVGFNIQPKQHKIEGP